MVSTVDKNNKFSFEPITADDISQQIKRLDINKATQESDIPTKLVKRFDNFIVDYLQENFNNCLKKDTFPKDFQKAAVHPTHKKDCKTEKTNYRPISILPNLSKIHKRLFYTYFSNFFPQHQCGFCKGYSAQLCLLLMTEKMKECEIAPKHALRSLLVSLKHLIVFCTIYDTYKFQILKKITIFHNILNIKRRLCLDCIRHFQRATSQGYIIL